MAPPVIHRWLQDCPSAEPDWAPGQSPILPLQACPSPRLQHNLLSVQSIPTPTPRVHLLMCNLPLSHISLCQSICGVGEASIQVSALSASSMCMIPDSNALWTVNLAGRHTYQATSCTQVQAALAPELCSMHLKVPCHDYAAIPHCIPSHASSFIEQKFPKLPWELQVSKSGQMARDNTFLPLHH